MMADMTFWGIWTIILLEVKNSSNNATMEVIGSVLVAMSCIMFMIAHREMK